MAYKSPGIYFSKVDNTRYENVESSVSTTVAIVGFAKQGPIGVPTEITSSDKLREIFGEPIDGYFAYTAAEKILSAGGQVLFVRVADTDKASKSNIIIKNGRKAANGELILNKTTDINCSGKNGKVFTGKLCLDGIDGKKYKTVFVRTPKTGSLTLSEFVEQINDSFDIVRPYVEYDVSTLSDKTGLKVFALERSNYVGGPVEEVLGPYIANIKNNSGISDISDAILYAINNKTYYQKIYFCGATTKQNSELYSDYAVPSGIYTINFVIGETQQEISIEVETTDKITDIVQKLNNMEYLRENGIKAEFCFYNEKVKEAYAAEDDTPIESPCILFVSEKEIKVLPGSTGKSLFALLEDKNNNNFEKEKDGVINLDSAVQDLDYVQLAKDVGYKTVYYDDGVMMCNGETNLEELFGFFAVASSVYETQDTVENLQITEEEDTNSIILNCESGVFQFRATNSILIDPLLNIEPNLIYNNLNKDDEFYFDRANRALLIKKAIFKGEENIDSILDKGKDGDIFITGGDLASPYVTFASNGKTNFPYFETNVGDSNDSMYGYIKTPNSIVYKGNNGYSSLSALIGDVYKTEEEAFEQESFYTKEGLSRIDDSSKDALVVTAKEYGEGTTNISFVIETVPSNFDGSSRRDFKVYKGTKEINSWEGVSFVEGDEKYFADLINSDEESIITVRPIKNEGGETLNINDTASYTSNSKGRIYLGTKLMPDAKNFADINGITTNDYFRYDYMVGENGDIENSDSLFNEQFDTLESPLSNKDMYDFHILITPDNIKETVQNTAIALCEFMGDAIYIADPPYGLSRKQAVKWHNGKEFRAGALTSNYACTYWPWVKVADGSNTKWAPPSVAMAARFCQVDYQYGAWYAPAGEINGVLAASDSEVCVNKNDRDEMYLNGNRLNPIVKVKNGNIIAYGEKTSARTESTLTKIHTIRMLCELQHTLKHLLKRFLFQPTMEENVKKVKDIVNSLLETVKTKGGISSYKVICDSTNNTTETLQQDILNVSVIVVPNGCIEQVEIEFTLDKSL